MKYFRGVEDYQGGSWGMYIKSIKDWRKIAMQWCDSDENWQTYNDLKYYRIKNMDLIPFIENYWQIKLVETPKEMYLKYKNTNYIENYESDYWTY